MIIRDAIIAGLGHGPMSLSSVVDHCAQMGACSRHATGSVIGALSDLHRDGLVESGPLGWYRLTEKACGASDAEIAQDGALKGAVVNAARKRGRG